MAKPIFGNPRRTRIYFRGPSAGASAPTLASIDPVTGSAAGGVSVTLTGTGFTGSPGGTLGGVAFTDWTVVSDVEITATTPAATIGTIGAQDVVIQHPLGDATLAGGYTATLTRSLLLDAVND